MSEHKTYTAQNGNLSDGSFGIIVTGENGIRHEIWIDTIIDASTDSEQIVNQLCDAVSWNMPDKIDHDGEMIFMHYGQESRKLG